RVRPAAEPDDEDAVAYLVVARDERVAAHDPRDQAGSADSPEDLRQEVVGIADAVQVLRDLLRRAIGCDEDPLLLVGRPQRSRRKLAGEIQKELEDVRRVAAAIVLFGLSRPVPGSIRTEDNVLGHESPPWFTRLSAGPV